MNSIGFLIKMLSMGSMLWGTELLNWNFWNFFTWWTIYGLNVGIQGIINADIIKLQNVTKVSKKKMAANTVWSSWIDHPYFFRIFHLTLMNERCYNVPTSNGGVWGRVCSATPTHLPRPPSLKNPKIIIFTNFQALFRTFLHSR